MIHKKNCVACGGTELYQALDLGSMPNSNDFVLKKDLKEIKSWPLKYYWCGNCTMFQQLDLVDETTLFRNNYTYQTKMSAPAIEHFRDLSQIISKRVKKMGFVVVIGSNDGTELGLFKEIGFDKVLGVEPAKNMAKIANDQGLKTVNDFFTLKLSKKITDEYGKADVVIANNVFAHIVDPKDMLLGMKNLINDDGQIVIEVQWFRDVFEKLSIETLYTEHYYEWTVKAMEKLSERCGMKLVNAEHMPDQQGGSVRFTLKLHGKDSTKLKEMEEKAGIYDKDKVLKLQDRAEVRKRNFVKLLKKLRSEKKTVVMWTVPAKVSTMLNFCDIDSSYIKCAYDSTPTKINRFIPKANIEIFDEKLLNENMSDMPDYIIIGAWNYLEFAKKKLAWFQKKGGKLVNMLTGEVIN
jgi:hypothetical protein